MGKDSFVSVLGKSLKIGGGKGGNDTILNFILGRDLSYLNSDGKVDWF